jgi:hypothetical protein
MNSRAFARLLADWRRRYTPDPRALSLMRIGIALVVISDLVIRAGDLSAHYTNDGIWPTGYVHSFGWKQGYWSIHTFSGDWWWQAMCFSLHSIAAVALLVGFRTRIFSVIVWLLCISLHNRNLFILQAGDDLLRLALFWGMFLPWNACWSFDARSGVRVRTRAALPAIGYLLLLASVYLFTFLLKTGDDWREGSAIYYALSLGQMRLATGDLLYGMPAAMKMLTWFVLVAEISLPVLILWPSKGGRTRWYAFVLIAVLHAGISLHLYVGLFFVISIVTALGLIPASKMDRLERLTRFPYQCMKEAHGKRLFMQPARDVFFVTVIALSLAVNLSGLNAWPLKLTAPLESFVNAMRLDQYWGMFSPQVMRTDGWFVYEGLDASGRTWDLRTGKEHADFSQPERIVTHYKSDRWRKLAENLQGDNHTFLRPLFTNFLLKEWNRLHPAQPMKMLTVYFMEKTNLPGYRHDEIRRKLIYLSHA